MAAVLLECVVGSQQENKSVVCWCSCVPTYGIRDAFASFSSLPRDLRCAKLSRSEPNYFASDCLSVSQSVRPSVRHSLDPLSDS